jgi:hypothetical protein
MAARTVSATAVGIHPDLVGLALASPRRRFVAFACDVVLLAIPS